MPTNILTQWLRGASYPWRALAFLRRHNIWRLALAPIAVNLFLLGAVVYGGIELVWPWMHQLGARLQSYAADADVVRMAVTLLIWCLWILLVPLIVIGSCTVVLLLGQMVAGPFLEILSERVECLALGRVETPFGLKRFIESVFLGLGDAMWSLVYLVAIYLPLPLLGLIPVVGAAASLYFGALLLTQEFLGPPLARHMVSYRARWSLLMRHKSLAFGFGCGTMLLVAIPGINLLMLPVACVGGTLLYCDMFTAGLLKSVVVTELTQSPQP